MKIGLTYDLRSDYLKAGYSEIETAEFDRDDTVQSIENVLKKLGYDTDRIGNSWKLVERLAGGHRWDLVFNIAEGLYGIGREAQVPAILDAYNIPYTFSDPLVMSLTLHKGMTKRVIRDAGIPTTDFFVYEKWGDEEQGTFLPPFFIKPVAEGTGKGVNPDSIIHHTHELGPACEALLLEYGQPVLVERYLSGREFTVGILGTGMNAKILGTMEVLLLAGAEKGVYSYVNKERSEDLVEYRPMNAANDSIVKKSEEIALSSWRVLGCRDAGRVDIRCDREGQPFFMEVNPLAGLHPDHSDLPIICKQINMDYKHLIKEILDSAKTRVAKKSAQKGEG